MCHRLYLYPLGPAKSHTVPRIRQHSYHGHRHRPGRPLRVPELSSFRCDVESLPRDLSEVNQPLNGQLYCIGRADVHRLGVCNHTFLHRGRATNVFSQESLGHDDSEPGDSRLHLDRRSPLLPEILRHHHLSHAEHV